jgi:hypothetical protein
MFLLKQLIKNLGIDISFKCGYKELNVMHNKSRRCLVAVEKKI